MSDRYGRANYDYEATSGYASSHDDHVQEGAAALVVLLIGIALGVIIVYVASKLFGSSSGGTFSGAEMDAFKKVETLRKDVEEVQKLVSPKPPSLPPYYTVAVNKAADTGIPDPPPPVPPPPPK